MSIPTPSTDLTRIQRKVRTLTGSFSESQLTTPDLNDYINTFYLYDFPEHLRLFSLRDDFVFYTQPNVGTYDQNNTDYDPNTIISVLKPIYISGYDSFFSQSQAEFYALYPRINFQETMGQGNGVLQNFTYTLTETPVLQNEITIGAQDVSGNTLQVRDDGNGNLIGDVLGSGTNTINYVTGAVDVTFNAAVENGGDVTIFSVPYTPSRPDAMLFFDNQFILRPVPDKVYKVSVEVYRQPTYLMNNSSSPLLKQWWQFIAFGAAKKILEERQDLEGLQAILPFYKEQELLVLRRTIVQQTNERVATIFTEQASRNGYYDDSWGFL